MNYNASASITGQINPDFARNLCTECDNALKLVFKDMDDLPYTIDVQVRDDIPAQSVIPGSPFVGVQIPHENLLHNTAYIFIKHNSENLQESVLIGFLLAKTVLERNIYMSTIKPADENSDIFIYNKRAFSTTFFEPHAYPWIVEARNAAALLSKENVLH